MKIAFVGGGNMGEAILAAVLREGLSTPESSCVSDISTERREYLAKQYGVAVTEKSQEAVSGKDIVILAIKPQNLAEVMTDLRSRLEPTQLVLSIVAGASIESLSQGLGHDCIVRAMPNTPAQIGYGISAWTATADVTGEQRAWARDILGATGGEIFFSDEKYLNMVTAVSGSGPAYFFLLAGSLIDAAVSIGLPQKEAEELVSQTMLGSAHLMQKSGKAPAELIQNVASRGGTTERALQVFEEGGFADLVKEAVRSAYQRAGELGS